MKLTVNFLRAPMIDLTNIHSLSEFQRNTKHFCLQMQESEKPLVLTVNGEAQLVGNRSLPPPNKRSRRERYAVASN